MARVSVSSDTSGIAYATGVIEGISTEIETRGHLNSILPYVHSKLQMEFELWIDALAAANPQMLHHVYEWGQLGSPSGRLWESVLRGRGRDRTATVIWKASKKAVPVAPELQAAGSTGKSVKNGVHIFYWKAPVMESGMTVTVRPKLSSTLAFLGLGGVKFSSKPVQVKPGGAGTTGSFFRNYYAWWNTIAPQRFAQKIAPGLERDIEKAAKFNTGRTRTRSFSITTNKAAEEAGKRSARLLMQRQQKDYTAAARSRRAFIYGD